MGLFTKKKEMPKRQLYSDTADKNSLQEEEVNKIAGSDLYEGYENVFETEIPEDTDYSQNNLKLEDTENCNDEKNVSVEEDNAGMKQENADYTDNCSSGENADKFDLEEDKKTELLNTVLDYFIANEGKLLSKMQDNVSEKLKKTLTDKAKEQFKLYHVKGKNLEEMIDCFTRYMWGYYILDPLIEDKSIFDIKCYSYKNIRIKRMGQRMAAPENIRFSSPADYNRFVKMSATKNQVNLSAINSLVTFTDSYTSDDFIMRFDISTEYVNTSKVPCLHIRKIPKTKYSMEELVEMGFMTEEQRVYFEERAVNSGGILFTGSGGSGKTTFMNSLLELYPHDRSALVIQENEELFSDTHPDMNFQHVVQSNGEGKINYSLETLSRQGLLNDIDLFVIGEIKGNEAASFAMCSYTGAQAWCSCHGKNETEAIYKLADYVKQATGYTLNESLKMLSGIEVIVYLKNFHVEGVSEIKGWDYEKDTLIIEKKEFGKNEGERLCDTVSQSSHHEETNMQNTSEDYSDYLKLLL